MFKKAAVEIISFLFISLFVYASVTKLMDYEKFSVQLGQSPLLMAFAGWVTWLVPSIELVVAALLAFPRSRLVGMYCSFTLMVMFTAYIIIILNFADHVPCSCGGILQKMGWTEHLIFNIIFVGLGLIGVVMLSSSEKQSKNVAIA